ncbi:hypothetical protein [Staphylococcus pasteuri]|nr:hypothetical protein [Staphylococcus pasteuri]MEB7433328.1 hypothetical protein [Staphylococcus pasteuri]
MQKYILKIEDGRYYSGKVSVYAGGNKVDTILETTDDILKAETFEDYDMVCALARNYGCVVCELCTYIKEVY